MQNIVRTDDQELISLPPIIWFLLCGIFVNELLDACDNKPWCGAIYQNRYSIIAYIDNERRELFFPAMIDDCDCFVTSGWMINNTGHSCFNQARWCVYLTKSSFKRNRHAFLTHFEAPFG